MPLPVVLAPESAPARPVATTAPLAAPSLIAVPRKAGRLDFVDWARGLACVLMFEAHALDAWVRAADRVGFAWALSRFFASIPSSLFVFLAGVGIALKGDALLRRADGALAQIEARRRARREIAWRGLGIIGFGVLFRLFYFLLDRDSHISSIFRVDILNLIGVAIVLAALVLPRRPGDPNLRALGAGVVFAIVTPPLTRLFATLPAWVPAALTDYVAERKPWRDFPAFPMAAFVFFGLFAGALIARASRRSEPRSMVRLAIVFLVAGGALALLGHAGERELYHLCWPIQCEGRVAWAVIPVVFYFVGLEVALLGACYFLLRARPAAPRSPLRILGQTSLLVYFVHIEFAYGLFALPLRGALRFGLACAGLLLFTALMVGVGAFRLRAAGWLRRYRAPLVLASGWALGLYSIIFRIALRQPAPPRPVVVVWILALTGACGLLAALARRATTRSIPCPEPSTK